MLKISSYLETQNIQKVFALWIASKLPKVIQKIIHSYLPDDKELTLIVHYPKTRVAVYENNPNVDKIREALSVLRDLNLVTLDIYGIASSKELASYIIIQPLYRESLNVDKKVSYDEKEMSKWREYVGKQVINIIIKDITTYKIYKSEADGSKYSICDSTYSNDKYDKHDASYYSDKYDKYDKYGKK